MTIAKIEFKLNDDDKFYGVEILNTETFGALLDVFQSAIIEGEVLVVKATGFDPASIMIAEMFNNIWYKEVVN